MMTKDEMDTWCWNCDGNGEILVKGYKNGRTFHVYQICRSCNGTGRRKRRALQNPSGKAISDEAQATLDLDDD